MITARYSPEMSYPRCNPSLWRSSVRFYPTSAKNDLTVHILTVLPSFPYSYSQSSFFDIWPQDISRQLTKPLFETQETRNHGRRSSSIEVHVSLLEKDFSSHPPLPLHQHSQCLSRRWQHVQSANHCSPLPHHGQGSRRPDREDWKGGAGSRRCPRSHPSIVWKSHLRKGQASYQQISRSPRC